MSTLRYYLADSTTHWALTDDEETLCGEATHKVDTTNDQHYVTCPACNLRISAAPSHNWDADTIRLEGKWELAIDEQADQRLVDRRSR